MRNKDLLDAYTQYRLMPIPYRGEDPHRDSPVMCFVKWKNPYSTEHIKLKNGLGYLHETFLTHKNWCRCTTISCWSPETFRHFILEEFVAHAQKDPEFSAFMGLSESPINN